MPLAARMVCSPGAVPGVYVAVLAPVETIVPTVAFPPDTLSTDHVGVPPPGTVAVNSCFCHKVIPAALGVTVTLPVAIVTVAVAGALEPAVPVQVSE
jgi:hypothetical protein